MPYESTRDLPEPVRNVLPEEAQRTWLSAYNSAEAQGRDQASRAAIAWSALERAGWEKDDEEGKWVKKGITEFFLSFYKAAKNLLPAWVVDKIQKESSLKNNRSAPVVDIKEGPVEKRLIANILKIDGEKQIVTGVVLEPETEDAQGDIISVQEIEKAAHHFLANSRVIGKQHEAVAKAEVVESYLAPEDLILGGENVKAGTWIMSVKVNDGGLWGDVKSGEITGFSIGAMGIRQAVI